MLTFLAHPGVPPAPHDVWSAWNIDPLLLAGLVVSLAVYRAGWMRMRSRPGVEPWRWRLFLAGLAVLALATVSPVDALGEALASAHMVQHLLLILVAAPLLAMSAPLETGLWGLPRGVRKQIAARRQGSHLLRRGLQHPVLIWLAHAGALWLWHAQALYEAALTNPLVHILEHLVFLVTGVAFWWLVLRRRDSSGLPILAVFTMGFQGVILSALLAFSSHPWYPSYAETAPAWGMAALSDQQLAGVIMWVPGSLVYLAAIVRLVARWVQDTEQSAATAR